MNAGRPVKRFVIGAVVASLVAAGCAAGATPTPTGPFKLHLQLTPSHVSVAVADDQGFFKGIDLDQLEKDWIEFMKNH